MARRTGDGKERAVAYMLSHAKNGCITETEKYKKLKRKNLQKLKRNWNGKSSGKRK